MLRVAMLIDLRSDTVTKPSAGMRRAMADASVGDDVYGEDPTARALEEQAAELLGHEAALFLSSGSMGNLIALMLHCRRGDDVIVGENAHTMLYESGGAGGIAGVQLSVAGRGGTFTVQEMDAARYPAGAYHMPRTRLVAIENTHNRAGGVVWPDAQVEAVCARARELGLATHLDGARIWNAAVARSRPVAELAAPFDTVTACFSKGLGAPAGSVLAGDTEAISEAKRLRKMLGGAMRQVGVLCAAALYALDHHYTRLAEDHENARRLAAALSAVEGVSVDPASVHTNIVNLEVKDAAAFAARAREGGVLVNAMSATTVRAVTHLEIDRATIGRAADALAIASKG
jgi:threonine aldolase